MVASRGRFTALWFAALMLASTFVAIAPTASAADITYTGAALPKVLVNFGAGFVEPSASQTVAGGLPAKITYSVNVPDCVAGGGTGLPGTTPPPDERPRAIRVTAAVAGILIATDQFDEKTFTTGSGATAMPGVVAGEIAFTTVANAGFEGASSTLGMTARATCRAADTTSTANGCSTAAPCTWTPPADGVRSTANAIRIDTKPPTITVGTIARTETAGRVGTPSSTDAIGTRLTIPLSATDGIGTVAAFTVDSSQIPGGATTHAASATEVITIAEASPPAVTAFNEVDRVITLTASDSNGNSVSQTITRRIDNERPNPSSSQFTLYPSEIVRVAPGPGASNPGAVVSTGFAPTPAVDRARAVVTVGTTTLTTSPIISATGGPTTTITAITAAQAAIGASPRIDPLTTPVTVTLQPVDLAGNINTATSASRSTLFPNGISVAYGGVAGIPQSVEGGGKIGTVFVDITSNGPDLPLPSQNSGLFWGQFMRQRADGSFSYWKVSTGDPPVTNNGANPTPSNDNSATNNFATTAQTDPRTPASATYTTAFQPSPTYDDTLATSGTRSYSLTNLSGKSFKDGVYRLELNIMNNGARSDKTRLDIPVLIDNTPPKAFDRSTAPSLPDFVRTPASGAHGLDGNPIAANFSADEWRTQNSEGREDTGIKTVTIQLVNADGSVVQRTGAGDPARITLAPGGCRALLPYCVDLGTSSPGACGVTNPTAATIVNPSGAPNTACAWSEIHTNGNWSTTFLNATAIGGYINHTLWSDLPSGRYKVQILAEDNAGRVRFHNYTSEYVVAPIVKLVATSDSPKIVEDKLYVEAFAAERFETSKYPDSVAGECVGDACPARSIRVYVSNTNGVNDAGKPVPNGKLSQAALVRSITDGRARPEAQTSSGYSGYKAVEDYATAHLYRPGELKPATLTYNMWKYSFADSPPTVPTGANGVTLSSPVYVRLEACALDPATGVETTACSRTAWVRATSSSSNAFNLTQPVEVVGGVALNQSSEFDDVASTAALPGPFFRITFDRKIEPDPVRLNYTIYDLATPTVAYHNSAYLDPLLSAGVQPRYLFNWTGALAKSDTIEIPAGEYLVHFEVHAAGATAGTIVGDALGTVERRFTVVAARPSMQIKEAELGVGVAKRAGLYYVAPVFQVPLLITHGQADLASDAQLKFKLVRAQPGEGEAGEIAEGTNNFDVSVLAGFDRNSLTTDAIAVVHMPDGLSNNNRFDLVITAEVDPTGHVGNASATLPLRYDNQKPTGALDALESEYSVLKRSTTPPRNYEGTELKPYFFGYASDEGAGVREVEVRIVDATRNKTIRLTTSGTGFEDPDGDLDYWVSAKDLTSSPLMQLAPADGLGRRAWTIPLTGRAGLPDLFDRTNEINSLFKLSNRYKIEVRVTDELGQVSAVPNVTYFDFDAAGPFLGWGSKLDTEPGVASGISAATHKMPWHGSAILSVNVTDNHCIRSVRLRGTFDGDAANVTPLMANMSPVGVTNPDRVCYGDAGFKTATKYNIGTKFHQYQIDLAGAPNFTDRIGTYTYWFEAEDLSGNTSEVPVSFRSFKMQITDNAPATVKSPMGDPSPGQAGGRTTFRADVFDNLRVDHVDITVYQESTQRVLAKGAMRPPVNASVSRSGIWTADSQEDLNWTLVTGTYLVNVTAYDENWNRTAANGGPTCPNNVCLPSLFLYSVRDDGEPATTLESPTNGSTVNATPIFRMRALNKNIAQSDITVVAGPEGNATAVAASSLTLTELLSPTGARQGWTVTYAPTGLVDATNYTVSITARVGTLVSTSAFKFRVDSLPPIVTVNATGTRELGGKTWITAATRVAIEAVDNVSTVTRFYSVNGGPQQTYAGEITPTGADGEWRLEYWASDSAGNVAAKKSLLLNLDKTGPRISVVSHGDTVAVAVNDAGVGLNESSVTVHYRYGNASAFTPKPIEKAAGNSFSTSLGGNSSETGLAYYFTAEDLIGNVGTNFSVTAPHVIRKAGTDGGGDNETPPPTDDLPPTIAILQPLKGASVRGAFDLKWSAEDPGGKPLSISIALRDPPPNGRLLVAAMENTGIYRVNVSGPDFPAGAYTIVVTASNGPKSEAASVTFNVEAGETIKPLEPPCTVCPSGEPVNVPLSIEPAGKTVTQANFRVLKDGQLFTAGRLTPTQGKYVATFTPTAPGNYRVLVDVGYSDGSSETAKQVAAFSVAGGDDEGSTKVFPTSLMGLLAISVLTAGLAAYGTWRWRK